ncbi:MAG: hypothetical protein Q4C73_12465, partial [Eubacteriales bacterium]|nr:hypothetical protein [Eubacteriales bacterium]
RDGASRTVSAEVPADDECSIARMSANRYNKSRNKNVTALRAANISMRSETAGNAVICTSHRFWMRR